jgi:NADPH:quinone reductase-like Zn-dependent oxidoreductase
VQDVDTALGLTSGADLGFGIEASGVIEAVGTNTHGLVVGDRVMTFGQRMIASAATCLATQCVKIPENISFEAAASMPYAYSTAIHGLIRTGNLQKNETILIHSACGASGLAALQISQMIGTKVRILCIFINHYTDQGRSLQQRAGMTRRSISWRISVSQENGRGADLVWNNLSGQLMQASWQCVAESGRMIEIGTRELPGHMAMELFKGNRTFIGVDVTRLSAGRVNS